MLAYSAILEQLERPAREQLNRFRYSVSVDSSALINLRCAPLFTRKVGRSNPSRDLAQLVFGSLKASRYPCVDNIFQYRQWQRAVLQNLVVEFTHIKTAA